MTIPIALAADVPAIARTRSQLGTIERYVAIVRDALDPPTTYDETPTPRAHARQAYLHLGEMQYELAGPVAGLEVRSSSRLAEHAVIDGKPVLQHVGDELEEITLALELHTEYCDVVAELDRLRAAQSAATILSFTFANGRVRGRYVIAELDETHNQHTGSGDPVSVSVRLTLKEWTEDLSIDIQRPRAPAPAVKQPSATTPATARAKPGAVIRGGDPHAVPSGSILRGGFP